MSTDGVAKAEPDTAAGATTELVVEIERQTAQDFAKKRKLRRAFAPWTSMMLSLGVTLLIVLGVIALVPRPSRVTQPAVNVVFGARAAEQKLSFAPAVPQNLPDTWRPTSVRTTESVFNVMTWHIGYQTTQGDYAAVEQGADAPARWVLQQVNRGAPQGQVLIDGEQWNKWVRTDKVQNSLTRTSGTVTTVVTGTASFAELTQLVQSLPEAAE